MSVSDIEEQIREVYHFDVSPSTISRITEVVANYVIAWQNRPLDPVYLIVWMNGIVFKVRENSKVVNKTIYLAVGLNKQGLKCLPSISNSNLCGTSNQELGTLCGVEGQKRVLG